MSDRIFQFVYSILMRIAELTGFSYNEINIIAYYIVLPFAYIFLLDRIMKTHVLKILYVSGMTATLLLIRDFSTSCDWLFQKSVDFLLSFEILGWNYVVSSVLICVVLPAIVLIVMFHFAYPQAAGSLRRLARKMRASDQPRPDP
jgi:hypothetical protein